MPPLHCTIVYGLNGVMLLRLSVCIFACTVVSVCVSVVTVPSLCSLWHPLCPNFYTESSVGFGYDTPSFFLWPGVCPLTRKVRQRQERPASRCVVSLSVAQDYAFFSGVLSMLEPLNSKYYFISRMCFNNTAGCNFEIYMSRI